MTAIILYVARSSRKQIVKSRLTTLQQQQNKNRIVTETNTFTYLLLASVKGYHHQLMLS